VRKAGKLPGETKQASYSLEYGQATVEVQVNAFDAFKGKKARALLVDDLLATGGTLGAAAKASVEAAKATNVDLQLVEAFLVMEITALKGRENAKNAGIEKITSLLSV